MRITPGIVEDNGGKEITEIETYIRGGEYGATLNSLGTGSGIISVSSLDPNTTYEVITRATNGITESYSEYTIFITLGNVPEFVDIYASNISLTEATIDWFANYEYNAEFKQFIIEWRYKGDTSWSSLDPNVNLIENTNFDNLDHNTIEYKITVTDSWDRSTSSEILTYSVIHDYSDEVSELECTKNEDDSYTITGTWSERVYNKIESCFLLGNDEQLINEIPGDINDLHILSTGFTFKTKQYKNSHTQKIFLLYLKTTVNNDIIYKTVVIPGEEYNTNFIKMVDNSNNIKDCKINILSNEGPIQKEIRQHDIIKLSKFIRYIDIDSRGTSDNNDTMITGDKLLNCGPFKIICSYQLLHETKTLYKVKIISLGLVSNSDSEIRIRNNGIILSINSSNDMEYKSTFIVQNMIITNETQYIDTSNMFSFILQEDKINTNVIGNLTIKINPEYDFQESKEVLYNYSIENPNGNSDVSNNHLVSIKVYDKDENNIAEDKILTLTDGSDPIVYNNGNPTNNDPNQDGFIYSENGLPIRLDLGKEYNINRIEIQRRLLESNTYIRNYIIGRNNNKEICYIFYDSNVSGEYSEENTTFNI